VRALVHFLSISLTSIFRQVMFFERDIRQIKAGEKIELNYANVTGIKPDLSGPKQVPDILDNSIVDGSSSDEASGESDSEDGEKKQFVSSARPRDESPNSRKVNFAARFFNV
jgi:RIO kinase 1